MRTRKFFAALICTLFLLAWQSYGASASDTGVEMNGNVYVNKKLGVEIHFNDDWKISSMEESKAVDETVRRMFPEFREKASRQDNHKVIRAERKDSTANIDISILNTPVSVVSDNFADQYVKEITKMIENMYKTVGGKDFTYEKWNGIFLGKKCFGLRTSVKLNLIHIYQKQVIYTTDENVYCFTVTSFIEDKTEELMNMFNSYHAYTDPKTDIYGEVKDGVYTNKTLGAEAYFNDKWQILSSEEIAVLMGYVSTLPTSKDMENIESPSFYAASKDRLGNS